MKHTYLPIEQAKAGDIVEAGKYLIVPEKTLHQVIEANEDGIHISTAKGGIWHFGTGTNNWKLIKTLPGTEAKTGDTIIRTIVKSTYSYCGQHIVGKLETVEVVFDNGNINTITGGVYISPTDFRVICQEQAEQEAKNPFKVGDRVRRIQMTSTDCPLNSEWKVYQIDKDDVYFREGFASHYANWELVESTQQQKRNLAFYKHSGEPWSQEEYDRICTYVNSDNTKDSKSLHRKFIFASGGATRHTYMWSKQEDHPNFKNCKKVAYEDMFKTASEPQLLPRQTKEYFDAFQIVYDAGVELAFSNSLNKPYWAADRSWVPNKQWRKHKGQNNEKYKQANLPPNCPDDQFSDEYWEFWEKFNTMDLDVFNYTNTRWETNTTSIDRWKERSEDNMPRLFRIKEPQAAQPEPIINTGVPVKLNDKENTMSTTPEKITIEIDANLVKKADKPAKIKTALEASTKRVLLTFNAKGDIVERNTRATKKDIADIRVKLQQPNYLGYTFNVYEFTKSFTTDIPITVTKAK